MPLLLLSKALGASAADWLGTGGLSGCGAAPTPHAARVNAAAASEMGRHEGNGCVTRASGIGWSPNLRRAAVVSLVVGAVCNGTELWPRGSLARYSSSAMDSRPRNL